MLQVFWLMLIFYGAPARLPAYDTTPSACPTYTLVNMTRAPPFSLQTDIPVPNPRGVDLCCVPGSLEDPCLVQDGGVYLEGRMSDLCTSTVNVYCISGMCTWQLCRPLLCSRQRCLLMWQVIKAEMSTHVVGHQGEDVYSHGRSSSPCLCVEVKPLVAEICQLMC